ncbi:circadian clock-controlled protein daywake-like [Diorhabda sublineata]|uniref:circadian clock-controlled protein daywake-like n=1 Tax=Diorhabda sublineata TaxID=1163346 RepID=UPI0024E12252|nr:circadian clock-controlled protein daywake-like [Diorhabda sublineata]
MRVVYFLLYFLSVEAAKKLPSYVEQCYRNPPNELSECIKRNINNLRSKVRDGISELSIPSLNPLILDGTAVLEPNADFRCEVENIKLWNMNNLVINNFEMELGKVKKWSLDIGYSYISMDFKYKMKGKLLVLQLDSSGTGFGNVTGVNLKIDTDLTTYVKNNGKEYLTVKDVNVKMDTDSGHFNFENLFKDKEDLNERANRIINENYKVFLEDFKPLVENIIKSFVKQLFNTFYSKFSYDVLFPEKVQ